MIKQALKIRLQWDAKYAGQLHGFAQTQTDQLLELLFNN